jgi:hypothetical protein
VLTNNRGTFFQKVILFFTCVTALGHCCFAQEETPTLSQIPSEQLLPASTKGWFSVPDAAALQSAVDRSQFGQLLNDPDLKPWVADIKKQVVELLNKNNVRLGFEFADLEPIRSGEVSIGAVHLPEPADYAIVLLVNVKGSEEEAQALLTKIGERLTEREAKKTEKKIHDVVVNQWTFPARRGYPKQKFSFNAIADDWLIITDQESVCREIIRRIVLPVADDPDVLAADQTFKTIQDRVKESADKQPAHVQWYVEPWGYVKIAKMIADEQNVIRTPTNDYARIYQDEGFDAIKAVGGWFSVAVDEYELVHQTFVYAPAATEGPNKYLRAAAILDFSNPDENQMQPLDWMPNELASLTSVNWDLNKVFSNVGTLIESMMGSPGSYQNMIEGFESEMKLDLSVKELVASFGRRINIITDVQMPIDERSERVLITVEVKKNAEQIADTIEKFIGEAEFEAITHNGHRIIVVDLTKAAKADLLEIDDALGGSDALGGIDNQQEEEQKGLKPIFEKRVICVALGHVLISNNVDYMKTLLDRAEENPGEQLRLASDFQRIQHALNELDSRAPSFSSFGRVGKSVRVNYEMVRQGKMDSSQTMLAQIMEQLTPKDDLGIPSRQKLDVAKMPADFEKSVGKYLGIAGWKLVTEEDGWLIVGCILKKEPTEKAVEEKTDTIQENTNDKNDDKQDNTNASGDKKQDNKTESSSGGGLTQVKDKN